MTEVYERLAHGVFTSATPTLLYTAPALTTVHVRKLVVSNNDATAGTVKLYHVESAGSPGATNVLLPTTPLDIDEHGENPEIMVLNPGDMIYGEGDGTTGITYAIYGVEVS